MSSLKKFRLFFHRYFLKKQLAKQKSGHEGVAYNDARTVGILFEADDIDRRDLALAFAKRLKDKGKKVSLLGYFDHPVDSPNYTFPYFTRSDLDWALRPKKEEARTFMDQPFDIWITADTRTSLHAEYLAALSRAKLRVGPVTIHTECYELMIDPKDDDLKSFLKQIENLLEKTNAKHEEAA